MGILKWVTLRLDGKIYEQNEIEFLPVRVEHGCRPVDDCQMGNS